MSYEEGKKGFLNGKDLRMIASATTSYFDNLSSYFLKRSA
jgi:hypothetical protein